MTVKQADVWVDNPEHPDSLTSSELLAQISLGYEYRRAPEYEQARYP